MNYCGPYACSKVPKEVSSNYGYLDINNDKNSLKGVEESERDSYIGMEVLLTACKVKPSPLCLKSAARVRVTLTS